MSDKANRQEAPPRGPAVEAPTPFLTALCGCILLLAVLFLNLLLYYRNQGMQRAYLRLIEPAVFQLPALTYWLVWAPGASFHAAVTALAVSWTLFSLLLLPRWFTVIANAILLVAVVLLSAVHEIALLLPIDPQWAG